MENSAEVVVKAHFHVGLSENGVAPNPLVNRLIIIFPMKSSI